MTSTKSNSNGHSDLHHSTTSINLHCGNQNPPHERKKKKKGPSHYLPLPNHKTITITITKPKSARRKKTITKPRSVRRKKKDREANTSRRQANSKQNTHTHTPKPTMANLHKSKPIMVIHCTTTHYDPDPQPTIPLPPYSTHNPQARDPRLSQSEITNP